MSPEEEISRAERARQLLDDELFKESVSAVRNALISGIERSAITDATLREKLGQQLIALSGVLSILVTHMETGRLAQEELKQRATRKKVL